MKAAGHGRGGEGEGCSGLGQWRAGLRKVGAEELWWVVEDGTEGWRRWTGAGPRLSGEFYPNPRGGGGSEAEKQFVYPKSTTNFGPPLINFFFLFLRKHFLMWVGGVWGSGRGAQAAIPPPRPLTKPKHVQTHRGSE